MHDDGSGEASAAAILPFGARLLHPEEQLFSAMLDGFEMQQRSRFLAEPTNSGAPVVRGAVRSLDE